MEIVCLLLEAGTYLAALIRPEFNAVSLLTHTEMMICMRRLNESILESRGL